MVNILTNRSECIEWVYKLSHYFQGKSPYPYLLIVKQYPKYCEKINIDKNHEHE